jgi:NAD+ synthase
MAKVRDAAVIERTLSEWLRERVAEAGVRGVIFGLSGGAYSSVVCALAARALGPERCVGVVMPIANVPEDEALGRAVGEHFGVRVLAPDLLPAFEALELALAAERERAALAVPGEAAVQLAVANLKPRLRMTALYYYANLEGLLVVGSSNRSEIAVGYSTKYGDSGADVQLLADLTKAEVRALGHRLGVPAEIVDRPPSAGLWAGQTDEGELGMTYDQIDRWVTEGSSGTESVDREIARRYAATRHKREMPPIAEVGAAG